MSPETPRDERAARLARLKGRALQVARELIERFTFAEKQIAEDLGISLPTLKTYVARAYATLQVKSRLELYALYHPLFVTCPCDAGARTPPKG